MAKVKRISINQLEVQAKEMHKDDAVIDWNGIEVTVKYRLSLKEMLGFVDSVVQSCFMEGSGTYLPEIKNFAIRANVLDTYANFTLPKNIETQYTLICDTDAYDVVVQNIDPEQFADILEAIDSKVEMTARANIERLNYQMGVLYDKFEALEDQIGNLFSSVTPDEVKKIAEAVSNGNLDEDKIVQAYIETQKEDEASGGQD